MWKSKSGECTFCTKNVNRKQSMKAQDEGKTQAYEAAKTSTSSRATEKGPGANDKERCESCGMWKPKNGDCKFCAKRVNRNQAAEAQAEAKTQKYEAAKTSTSSRALFERASHEKERCGNCGLWKPQDDVCGHCSARGTRHGSPIGIRQRPELPQLGCSFGSGKPFDKAEEARVSLAFEKALGWWEKPTTMQTIQGDIRAQEAKAAAQKIHKHTKERCEHCGNWKEKNKDCKHCAKLENRKQAAKAQAEGRTQNYEAAKTSTSSRAADKAGPGANDKERCPSCGMWKPKDGECKACNKRVNRKQAAEAQAEGRTQAYESAKTSTSSRDRTKLI